MSPAGYFGMVVAVGDTICLGLGAWILWHSKPGDDQKSQLLTVALFAVNIAAIVSLFAAGR